MTTTNGQKGPTTNSTYTQLGVQYFYESEMLNPSSVLLIKSKAKIPHLRVAARRWLQAEKEHE